VGHRSSDATHRAAKIGASRRAAAKIVDWGVEALDRIADTLLALLLPFERFLLAARLAR